MPYKEKEIEKKYFTIGEVAGSLNVATSLIRFWESEFDIIKPKKNRKGNRQFTREDIKNIKLIYHLVKEKGFTLQGARDFIDQGSESIQDKLELIKSLQSVRDFLFKLRQSALFNAEASLWVHTPHFRYILDVTKIICFRSVLVDMREAH